MEKLKLLGECVTKQAQSIRRYSPGAQVYLWSDMLDPNHNAHGNYYLVDGDFTGSWQHVPKDLVMAVWGGAPREKSLQFFAGQGFRTLVACYSAGTALETVTALDTMNLAGRFLHATPDALTVTGGTKWLQIGAPARFIIRESADPASREVGRIP